MLKIIKNNIPQGQALIRQAVVQVVECCTEEAAQIYKQKLTENRNAGSPNGPFNPPYSASGGWPATQTGQGAENVDFEHVGDEGGEWVSGFGVKGPSNGTSRNVSSSSDDAGPSADRREPGGMHLIDLVKRGWKGPAEVLQEFKDEIAQRCIGKISRNE